MDHTEVLCELTRDEMRAVEELRNTAQERIHVNCSLSHQFLVRFLRNKDLDSTKAFKLLRNYLHMRWDNPTLFHNLVPSSLKEVYDLNLQIILDEKDDYGRTVFIFRAGCWEPSDCSLDDVFRANYLILEELSYNHCVQKNGIVSIIDFDGFGFHKARHFSPRYAMRMLHVVQDSFPVRFQAIHIVNQGRVFEWMFAIIKPFLKEKIQKRIVLYGNNLESLHNQVGKRLLPDFLGGGSDIRSNSKFLESMMNKNDFYKTNNSLLET